MRPTQALIHRDLFISNLSTIRSNAPAGIGLCPAVKADAYGHGALEAARVLEAEGVQALGVATVAEGLALRQGGVRTPIWLFGSLQDDEVDEAVTGGLDLFVSSAEEVARAAAVARARGRRVGIHVKVDTGMGRLGCAPAEAEAVVEAVVQALPLEFTGLCTHFAASDGPGPVQPPQQLARFREVVAAVEHRGWHPRWTHAANSGGLVSWPESLFNLARPGIALYGYPPPGPGAAGLVPVMELVSRVGFVKTVAAGTPLSYGSRYHTTQETDVVTIPLGYADGYRRAWTNTADLLIAGRRYRVSGTVCMDQFLVDVGPDSGLRRGDPVVLFGPPGRNAGEDPPTAADLAALAGTISYEVLCGVSARVPRVWV